MVSINGEQFMPGTYEKSDGTISYNPSALINAIHPHLLWSKFCLFSHRKKNVDNTLLFIWSRSSKLENDNDY